MKACYVDPISIQTKLGEAAIDWSKLAAAEEAIAKGEGTQPDLIKDDLEVLKDVISDLRKIFDIPEMYEGEDGGDYGLSDPEVLGVLVEFTKYQQLLKKTDDSHPILQPITELEQFFPSSPEQTDKSDAEDHKIAVMKQYADSISTEKGSKQEEPSRS